MTEKADSTITQNTVAVRPPIVVVMGHVDHGKTTILDWYRKTKVVASESGGITQHIGAYEVTQDGRGITFIDTPGHELFSKLRSRGAQVADLAVIVVAADEGVKPQTREALAIAAENNLPYVVAINKMDKPEANPERVKQELAKENVLVESYGGKIPSVEVSGQTGAHMDDLLSLLLLLADVNHFVSHPEKPGQGVVLETERDNRRGISATLLVRDGTLLKGHSLVIGRSLESIKIFENFLGQPITEAGPSSPVRITGLHETPAVGDSFHSFATKGEAELFISSLPDAVSSPEKSTGGENTIVHGRPVFHLIVKADVSGSKEALEESLAKLDSDIVGVKILRSEVGDINESDVKLALATKLVTIVGFKVNINTTAAMLAEHEHVRIIRGDVIYEILDEARKKMEEIIPPQITRTSLGKAKILKIFKKDGNNQVIGGRVELGVVKKGAKIEISRMREVIGTGTIVQLQRNKSDADTVEKGSEFGMLIETKTPIIEGDMIEAFLEEITRQKLS
ncbi:MAG: translation initiation factor IF-2 [Candidatus Sungbacteria bacterium]|nr:translation initiation factor IF-2 [Candidatus Sungbacteria bacterium]